MGLYLASQVAAICIFFEFAGFFDGLYTYARDGVGQPSPYRDIKSWLPTSPGV